MARSVAHWLIPAAVSGVPRGRGAELGVPRRDGEVYVSRDAVKLGLHTPELRADVACDLLAKVSNA